LDIGVLGYIGIVRPKEHSPEVWSVPPVTPCIYQQNRISIRKFPSASTDSWLTILWTHYPTSWRYKSRMQRSDTASVAWQSIFKRYTKSTFIT